MQELNFIPEHNDWEDKTKQSECKILRSNAQAETRSLTPEVTNFLTSSVRVICRFCLFYRFVFVKMLFDVTITP